MNRMGSYVTSLNNSHVIEETRHQNNVNNEMFQRSLFLFDLILNVQSTIFQLYRDESSWVEPVLS